MEEEEERMKEEEERMIILFSYRGYNCFFFIFQIFAMEEGDRALVEPDVLPMFEVIFYLYNILHIYIYISFVRQLWLLTCGTVFANSGRINKPSLTL